MVIVLQLCEGFLVGKQTRNSYPTQTTYRASKRLELVHGDLCGPIIPPTPTGNRYFMLLVDDYSRVMWVYLLKAKDEALEVFKNFRKKVKTETEEKVKVLRTDRGGEFLSNQFTTYCNETGLERHYTSPRNRTVVEIVRSNLKTMCMPDVLVFGCVAHMRIAKSHLKKLDDRSMKLVHLGIEKGSKAYRLLDSDTGKLYVSRDVVFEEQQAWMWEKSVKIKATHGMSFTVEGFNLEEPFEDEFDPEPNLYNQTEEVELLKELMMIQSDEEPVTYAEASKRMEWVKAMDSELASIEKNNTWSLVNLPKNQKAIGLKWVYKVKRDPSGKILKYKERIVAKGYVQKYGVNYDEVFTPVARIETVRVILALAGLNGWRVHHLDVKSAFLNEKLEEEVYVSQPEGYKKEGETEKVYRLSKALYGLKQAPRAWNACLDKYLKSLRFIRCALEYSVYTKKEEGNFLIVGVYVDDLLVTGGVCEEHSCEDSNVRLQLHQKSHGTQIKVTERLTRRAVCRFMERPTMKHMQAVKTILRRSTGGMAFYVNGNLVTWASQKQRCLALSSCEAEFMAATMAGCQGLWLRRLLTNITGSKHIDIRFHFIRECVEKREITVTHVCGKEQKADLLTKPLARVKHEEMRDLIGVGRLEAQN
uniref:Zinc finger, CCHC-type n=1 Tax=Tanacetum cinerariifolium TaxID=118510 RepID=A0A6L2KZ67_TANCI|nr:zinc finger, CCHC-type [Tanacetum cinerariifolium]